MDLLSDQPNGQLSAVIFDLDGTLVDSIGDITDALNELLTIKGLAPYSAWEATAFVGNGVAALVERAFETRGQSLTSDELGANVAVYRVLYGARLMRSTRTYDGVVEAISRLRDRGIASAICTNKEEHLARSMIESLGLREHFAAIVGGMPGRPPKPSPEPLLETVARLGACRQTVVMVGDSAADVSCAKAAGIKAICVSFGYSQIPVKYLGADRVIDSFAELEAACQLLYGRRT